jgi:hypothetical protein
MIKTWKERKGLENSDPFRAFIGVEFEMQAEINELRAALVEQSANQINAELLAALKVIVEAGGIGPEEMFRDARDAITRAEGGAA